ncbi:MAG: exosome complex protein Rrp4 [Candidatus Micrarchaeia archaeon]|jgi:exosome complex component RRP4
MKQIVLPGTKIADVAKRFEGSFVDGNATFASVVSLRQDDRVIPLKGHYVPRMGDYVVGIVKEVRFSGFSVDLNSPYDGSISAKETREAFEVGDVISAKIRSVDEVHEPLLVEPRKLWGGRLIDVESVKVPRIIGRNGSMLSMLKAYSKSDLFVGKNGRIYLKNGDVALAAIAVLKICREAHLTGLTDRIKAFLEKESGIVISAEELAKFESASAPQSAPGGASSFGPRERSERY